MRRLQLRRFDRVDDGIHRDARAHVHESAASGDAHLQRASRRIRFRVQLSILARFGHRARLEQRVDHRKVRRRRHGGVRVRHRAHRRRARHVAPDLGPSPSAGASELSRTLARGRDAVDGVPHRDVQGRARRVLRHDHRRRWMDARRLDLRGEQTARVRRGDDAPSRAPGAGELHRVQARRHRHQRHRHRAVPIQVRDVFALLRAHRVRRER
mmetsp:Transcript_1520/g.4744  ORF Transcript_1520/g.4744 Transcript_1520/m.4744 type:complete len:212 (-) Transcript_1520:664-1299(-)